MNVVVTGCSQGIGKATTEKFLNNGHTVYGLDIQESKIVHDSFHFFKADVGHKSELPDIEDVNILINNAGRQTESHLYVGTDDMQTNFFGVVNCTEKYAFQPRIISVLNMASVSAHTGAEFPEYCASKGAVLTYTKWTANEIAKYKATCNSLSCGGVITDLNKCVMTDEELWQKIMDLTPLKKWATPNEIADWIYFLTLRNRSCTAQDIIIDNGETSKTNFIWL